MNGPGPVGVVGTGQLGLCFVERLRAAGLDVHAYDVDPAARLRAEGAGALIGGSPAEVAGSCGIVLICVTGPDQVRECSLGVDGLRDGVRGGSLIIDTSTSLPSTTREVAKTLAGLGVTLIDAPVSRGIPAARAGTLSIIVGADDPGAVERALPILKLLGTDIVTVGSLGDGHAVKLVNMMLMGAHLVASAEALGLAAADGTDAQTMVAALERSEAASYMTGNHLPRFALSRSYSSGFSLNLMVKDLGLGRKLADALAVPVPMADRVWHAYTLALHQLGNVDNMRLVPYLAALSAGRNLQQARMDALSGHLPDAAEAATAGSPPDVAAIVASSNAVATVEAARVARASKLSFRETFSVIDMSSGASRFTAQLATGTFSAQDSGATVRMGSMLRDTWAPVLGWAATLGDIAPLWSYSSAAEAAEGLFGVATS